MLCSKVFEGLRSSIFGSHQIKSQPSVGGFRAEEAREATQKALQVAEEAFRQVGGLEATAPGSQAGFQEGNGSVEPLPRTGDQVRLEASPTPHEVQGPALRLLDVVDLVDPPEVAPQAPALEPRHAMWP